MLHSMLKIGTPAHFTEWVDSRLTNHLAGAQINIAVDRCRVFKQSQPHRDLGYHHPALSFTLMTLANIELKILLSHHDNDLILV